MRALTIARFTLQEALSRKLILAAVLLSLVFLGLFTLGFSYLFDRMAANGEFTGDPRATRVVGSVLSLMGMYAVNFLASGLVLLISAGSISGEVDSGMIHAVLARPIRRRDYIVGRWLAYTVLIGSYIVLMAGGMMIVARIIAGMDPGNAPLTILFLALAPLILMTLGLLGSTRLSTLANGVVVFSLFSVAWLAGIIEFIGNAIQNANMQTIGILVSLVVPTDAVWRAASFYIIQPGVASAGAANIPFASASAPTTSFVVWALVYPLVALGLAVWSFARRDF